MYFNILAHPRSLISVLVIRYHAPCKTWSHPEWGEVGNGGTGGPDPTMENQKALGFLRNAGPEVIKLFSCSTQLSTTFIMHINVKMPTIVGILTFISKLNATLESSNA